MLLSFPAKDPALIGRCYRQLIAPLSGPIKDQDLRVVAPVLRLSDEVAVVVSHMLISRGHILQAAEDISAREILRGVAIILLRHGEVLGGTAATMVVAAMVAVMAMVAVVTVMAVMAVVVVVVVEDIVQETSEERCGKKWQHAILHCR